MGCVGVMDVAGSGGDGGRGGVVPPTLIYTYASIHTHYGGRPVQIYQHPFTFTFICGIHAQGLNPLM